MERLLKNLLQLIFQFDNLESLLRASVLPIIHPANDRVAVFLLAFWHVTMETARVKLKLNVNAPPFSALLTFNDSVWEARAESDDSHVKMLQHVTKQDHYFVFVFGGSDETAPHRQISEWRPNATEPLAKIGPLGLVQTFNCLRSRPMKFVVKLRGTAKVRRTMRDHLQYQPDSKRLFPNSLRGYACTSNPCRTRNRQ